jgi:hypothetical protein
VPRSETPQQTIVVGVRADPEPAEILRIVAEGPVRGAFAAPYVVGQLSVCGRGLPDAR